MKKILFVLILACAATRLLAISPVPYTEAVTFSARIIGWGGNIMTVYDESGSPSSNGTVLGGDMECSPATAWLRPGKAYLLNFGSSGLSEHYMSFIAPQGYTLYVDGVPRDMIHVYTSSGGYGQTYEIELRPNYDQSQAEMGSFCGVQLGKAITWSVGLGGLRTGRTAGRIAFREPDLSANPYTRANLYFSQTPNNGQITLVTDGPSGQTLRQVMMAQGIVDLVDDPGGNGYTMKIYDWHASPAPAWNGSLGLWTFSVGPWKTIRVESPGTNQLKITETEGTVSHVSLLSTSGSAASGAYVWTLQEGDGATWLRTITHNSSLVFTGGVIATGGTVTYNGGNSIHTFTSSGTFSVSSAPGGSTVDALLVGGGGGGGGGTSNSGGGGGGGGAVAYQTGISISATSYSVVVGAGGVGGTNVTGGSAYYGGTSTAFGYAGYGGGGAGGYSLPGGTGATGGGSGRDAGASGGTGSPGGSGGASPGTIYSSAGGGGGAVGNGNDGTGYDYNPWPGYYGNGGVGYTTTIRGVSETFGGGGGGSWYGTGGGAPAGGAGGGGNGANYGSAGTSGGTNTGGGGGAGLLGNGGSGGSGIVIIRYPTGPYHRDVLEEVHTGGATGTVVASTKYVYENVSTWGEELTQVIADPTTAALTTKYTYYTNSANLGNYRKVQSVTLPTGDWTVSEYYDDWNRRGQLKYRYKPWLDTPTLATSASTTTGHVFFYDYTYSWTQHYTRPTVAQEYINNTLVGQTNYANSDISWTGGPDEVVSADAHSSLSDYQTTVSEHGRGDANADCIGQPYVIQYPDQRQDSYGVALGDFDHTARTFSLNSSGSDWESFVVHGTTNSSGATSVSTYGGVSIKPVYLIPNQSTMDVIFYNNAGIIVRTEKQIYTGTGTTGFSLATYDDHYFDAASGRPTSTVASNGATTNYYYTNGLLSSTVDPAGTETDYTYDLIKRVATSIKKGNSGGSYAPQHDITTTYTYDGANRVRKTEVSDYTNSEKIVTHTEYDLAGRLASTTTPRTSTTDYTTNYDYSLGSRIVRVYLPPDTTSGATKITEVYPDGHLKSVTGSSMVGEQFYAYTLNTTPGTITTQLTLGSSVISNTTNDWLGRAITVVKPSGTLSGTVTTTNYYNSSGQLYKTSQPGLADTLYTYDTLGILQSQGLDLSDGSGTGSPDGALNEGGSDRITKHTWEYFSSSGWWRRDTTSTFANSGSNTATKTSKIESRLSGLATNRLSETNSYDVFGNVTTSVVDLNYSSRVLTATTTYPDATTPAVQVTYNGLVVSSTDKANVTTTFGFDLLGRPTTISKPKITGTGTNTTTTSYIPGTSQVDKVKDPTTATTVYSATYAYDNVGRISSVQDAVGNYVYYEYHPTGLKKREWGDTVNPVEYAYDSWGHCTLMTTYRDGGSWASSTWNTTGTPDYTLWDYDGATGLLKGKYDAHNLHVVSSVVVPISGAKYVAYTYTSTGKLKTRTWARGSVTTYYYFGEGSGEPVTGELRKVDYTDTNTTDLEYTYNRVGQIATVKDATTATGGTRTLNYNITGTPATLELQSEDLPSSFYGAQRITYPVASSGVIGRSTGLQLGTSSSSPASEQSITYGYESGTGRFNSLAAASRTLTYTYATNSSLLCKRRPGCLVVTRHTMR